jgi:hypothetical protein
LWSNWSAKLEYLYISANGATQVAPIPNALGLGFASTPGAKGATLDEINRAVAHDAWSYISDTKRLAKRCGGTPHWDGNGGRRRFWITMPQSGVAAAIGNSEFSASDPVRHRC